MGSQYDVSVIVPTYCEAENLPELVQRTSATLEGARLRGEIIIVDDNSPDDTREVCACFANMCAIRLLVRTIERGLSSAVLTGLRAARGSILVVMDGDLSHPPERIPALVGILKSSPVDFVIGSRYVVGGSTDETWSFYRRLNSKIATLLARPLVSAADPMAGFFAMRNSQFRQISSLDPIGFKIGLELVVKGKCRKVEEIPINFRNRAKGSSKLTIKAQIDYLRHLLRLYAFKFTVR